MKLSNKISTLSLNVCAKAILCFQASILIVAITNLGVIVEVSYFQGKNSQILQWRCCLLLPSTDEILLRWFEVKQIFTKKIVLQVEVYTSSNSSQVSAFQRLTQSTEFLSLQFPSFLLNLRFPSFPLNLQLSLFLQVHEL